MHMIVPINAGTLRVVCVINRNHAIPPKAAGNAETMSVRELHNGDGVVGV